MKYNFKSSYSDDTDFQLEYDKLIEFRKINKPLHSKIENHHIKPKCFFKKEEIDIQESENNKVNLKIHEHFMAHYFLFKIYEFNEKYYKRSKNMFDSMRITLNHYKEDLSMIDCALLFENEKINYYKILSKIEQKDIILICKYYKENDKIPHRKDKDLVLKRLGNKLSNLKIKLKNEKLLHESIELFKELDCEELLINKKENEDIILICEYYKENNKFPQEYSGVIDEERRLGRKLGSLIKKYKEGLLEQSSINIFKEYGLEDRILLSKEDRYKNRISEIFDFYNKSNKKPSEYSKDSYEKSLGITLSNIKFKFINNDLESYIIDHFKENDFEFMLFNQKENDIKDINLIIDFYKENGKKPSVTNNKTVEDKRLGVKIHKMSIKYKNKELDEDYLNIFKTNDCMELLYSLKEKELIDIKLIINFIKENNKNPNKRSGDLFEKRIGQRLIGLRKKYRDNKLYEESLLYIEEKRIENVFV